MLAPIEHVFGNHKHCGNWCYYLKAQKEGKKYTAGDNLPMYCKTADKIMYQQMNDAVDDFKQEDCVKETFHHFDTQQNEALNMVVSRYVPKF